jgi:hypothetical protein
MSENVLHHLIVGQAITSDQPTTTPTVLALSEDFNEETIAALQQAVQVTPLPVKGQRASQAFALAMLTNGKPVSDATRVFTLARTHYQDDKQTSPVYEYVYIPGTVLDSLSGDIQPIVNLLNQPIPPYAVTNAPLKPLSLPTVDTGSLNKDVTIINTVLADIADGDLRRLLAVLGAALDGGVIITGFAPDAEKRLTLVRGLMMLIPKTGRSHLTFSTNSATLNGRLQRVVFSDSEGAPHVHHIDWNAAEIDETLLKQSYVAHLLKLWQGDIQAISETLHKLNILALTLMPGQLLVNGLQAVVERHEIDLAVINREPVSTQTMIQVLDSDVPPERDTRLLYLEHLLRLALEERNTAAALRVAKEMDNDSQLDSRLLALFDEALQNQPDAVYVFVRTRLGEGVDERWLERLHQAAEKSLDVAIENGDAATISSWLNLISREPARYELTDILRSGILAARKRAADNPKLMQDLLVLAVKRQPETLATLLSDPQIMSILPQHIVNAIENFDSAAIENLITESRELFLLAVKRVLDAEKPAIISTIMRHLWDIHNQQQAAVLAPDFRPITLMKRMAKSGKVLVNGALETLLTLLLAGNRDDLFFEIAPDFARRDELVGVIAPALHQSGLKLAALMDIVNKLSSSEVLDAQDTVAVYTALLARYDAPEATLPLVEQLARVLVQHPETTASSNIMWKIAELSGELKSESMLRVSTKRLLHDIEQMVIETQVVDSVQRLRKAVSWSANGRNGILRWWRQYARTQGLAQLQKIDKTLDGKRHLEDLRSIVQTSIALRRVLGQRSLEEFAQDIHTTFTILEALADSFDPDGKMSADIDETTLRGELDAREEELPTEMRQVLATNLKELAQLITTLSDNRSKPSIMRSDESVERQLYIGEAQPQSAIDVMRWLSGYLVGVQKDDEND